MMPKEKRVPNLQVPDQNLLVQAGHQDPNYQDVIQSESYARKTESS